MGGSNRRFPLRNCRARLGENTVSLEGYRQSLNESCIYIMVANDSFRHPIPFESEKRLVLILENTNTLQDTMPCHRAFCL